MVIGVSGKYCSGKNYLSSLLEKRGWQLVDVDKLGHRALEEKKDEVTNEFGREICAAEGSIDRAKLGKIVFASAAEMKKLEQIIHPLMYSWTEQFCAENSKTLINAAVMERMKLYRLCTHVIWVKAPLCIRIKRALKRDGAGLSLFAILKRIILQRKLKSKHLSKFTDIYTIRNDGKADLSLQLDSFLEHI